jgi:sugar phosphate permease
MPNPPNNWRLRIFAVTWLGYAGFYLCRKNFSVIMPLLTDEFGYTKADFAWVLTGYSLVYMLRCPDSHRDRR